MVPPVARVRAIGNSVEHSSSSALLPNDVLSGASASSPLNLSIENLAASITRLTDLNPNFISRYMSLPIVDNGTNSGASVGASTFVTDANSCISDSANFQRSSSINMESYHNLPSSPLSFSSSDVNSLARDGATTPQWTPSHRNQTIQLAYRKGQSRLHTSLFSTGKEQELDSQPQMSKKPKLDTNAENVFRQYIIQQLLQKQETLAFQDYNLQQRALLQLHDNLQKERQRQVLQSFPQCFAVDTPQQMQHYLKQQAKHPVSAIHPLDSRICSRRLMQFVYHLQHRPSDNSITYWRKFVAEYYAPGAKKRWCLSLYNGVCERALGVFSQLALEAWHCDMCGSKSGKGFVLLTDANFELLPRLYQTYFQSGVLDELLFLDLPHEFTLRSGLFLLTYEKAVQETIYQQFRVVREGQLRLILQKDLKILSWEFCARCHDEVVPRSLIAPQVNELVQAAKRYKKSGDSSGAAVQNLQSTCNMFVSAESQLMKNLDRLLVNDLGFPKRYIRCLQIAEIVDSLKDLMTFSLANNIGPIDSLSKYSLETKGKTQKKEATPTPVMAEAVVTRSKRAAFAGMSSHQEPQRSSLNAEKQNPNGLVNNCNPNAYGSSLPGPTSTCVSLVQSSPITGLSSSMLSEFDDQLKRQMIDKILQQMESNTRAKADHDENVQVKEEVRQQTEEAPTTDMARRYRGNGLHLMNNCNAAGESTCAKGLKIGGDCFTATHVKQEPEIDKFYLPEAIRQMDREFFQIGALDAEMN